MHRMAGNEHDGVLVMVLIARVLCGWRLEGIFNTASATTQDCELCITGTQ